MNQFYVTGIAASTEKPTNMPAEPISPTLNGHPNWEPEVDRYLSAEGFRQVSAPVHVIYMIDHLYNIGGGEQALLLIIRHLPRDRFRPSVVTFKVKPRMREILHELGCPLHVFPLQRTYGWTGIRAGLRIRSLLRAERPDIVHTFFETSNTWGGFITKLSFGPLLVSSRRDMGILRSAKHKLAYKLINNLSDGVQTVSREVERMCTEKEGINRDKVFTVYNGIDIASADRADGSLAIKTKFKLGGASHIVATVANVRRIKGLDTLLRTADIVRRTFPSVLFVIGGRCNETQHFAQLQRTIKNLGLESTVRFLGPLEEVFPLLRISNVFCLLSRSEGFSNALLEAMACRLPCVVTQVGGNPEAITDGENGFLVPAEDAAAAADRVVKLLQTPEYAREIGWEARRTVETKFTVESMIAQLTGFYDQLLKSRSPSNANRVK